MSRLKNKESGEIISRYVDLNFQYRQNTTVQTSLDGTEYLTRFGAVTINYTVTVWVRNEGREAIREAADRLTLLEVSVRQGVFTGRIKAMSDMEKIANSWYKIELTISPDAEVTDR